MSRINSHTTSPNRSSSVDSREHSLSSATSYDSDHLNLDDTLDRNVSHLRKAVPEELHDFICVGFGPASLAIAVALHDALDGSADLSRLSGQVPKVAFLERQTQFAWHAGMLLPGAKMQISFIKDLATLRNPRSEFTFLNYLHRNNRLVDFTNLGTFLPQRIEYEDYMRWCAGWFDDVVSYGSEVLHITSGTISAGETKIDSFTVQSRDVRTGEITTRRTKNVIIAAGGKPSIPAHLPQQHPRVIHSSQYFHSVRKVLPDQDYPYRSAVIGGGQSAAEIFENLYNSYPNSRTTLLLKGAALRPSDDSPFVNEVFNPSRTADTFHTPTPLRQSSIAADRATNYGVVRLELLERIYEHLYTQRIKHASQSEWPTQILPYRQVVQITDSPVLEGGVRLHIKSEAGKYFVEDRDREEEETIDVDAVFIATGYRRDAHEYMLKDARGLLPEGSEKWEVGRDYKVQMSEGKVKEDAGVWLQGCNEKTHGLSDSLLSVLAVRGGEIVNSIFGDDTTIAPTERKEKGDRDHHQLDERPHNRALELR